MKRQYFIPFILVASIQLLILQNIVAQDENIIEQLLETEQETLEAIALYPEAERNAILEAAMHPEILVRMERMQNTTQQQFQELIMPLPEEDQKRMYNISRYPKLIDQVTSSTKKLSQKEVQGMAAEYPQEVREDLMWANRTQHATLVQIDNLYRSSEDGFSSLLDRYPEKTRESYNKLLQLPEVLQLLTENMNATVLLGDIYKQNPELVKMKLDSLNVVLAEQQTEELNEWRKTLSENPEALTEYEQAAKEFANEHGYSETEYVKSRDEDYTKRIYVHHTWQPYPYWFGWPYWYTYSYWYPYPWWYHWGYYYGPNNVLVFIGLPSHTFMHWHFYHYRHFYYYPHFTHVTMRYSDRYPRTHNTVAVVVNRWRRSRASDVPGNWFTEGNNPVQRIREYGAFKMDYEAAVQQNAKTPSEREFLEENITRYPTLEPALKEQPKPAHTQEPQWPVIQQQEQATKPPVQKQPHREVTPEKQPRQQPTYENRIRVIQKPQPPQQQIEKARDHHQNTWENPRQQPQHVTPPQQPAPSRQPVQQKPVKPKAPPPKQQTEAPRK